MLLNSHRMLLPLRRNGHHMPDLKSEEVQAERKKRRAAEKEASRWRKKAAELQELVEELQQQQQQVTLLWHGLGLPLCIQAQPAGPGAFPWSPVAY